VDLAMLLQKLVESYNSIFLQQYEVFYDGRLQKEIELEKEINAYNDKSKKRDEEKVKLQDKQEVVMKALMTKNNEIERLLEQQANLERQIGELQNIIHEDKEE